MWPFPKSARVRACVRPSSVPHRRALRHEASFVSEPSSSSSQVALILSFFVFEARASTLGEGSVLPGTVNITLISTALHPSSPAGAFRK